MIQFMTLMMLLGSVDEAHKTVRFDPNQDKTIVVTVHHEVGVAIQFSEPPQALWYSNQEYYQIDQLGDRTLVVKVIMESEAPMNIFAMVGENLVDLLFQQTSDLMLAERKVMIQVLPSSGTVIIPPPVEVKEEVALKLLAGKKRYDLASFSVWERDGELVIYQKPDSAKVEVVEVLKGKTAQKSDPLFHEVKIDGEFIRILIPPVDLKRKEKIYLSIVLQQSTDPIILEVK